MSKNDFDNTLTIVNKKNTSSKTKCLEAQKKLNILKTKGYSFLISRMYFVSNDGSQIMFVYQPTLDTSELKKDKGTDYVLRWNSKGLYTSKLKPLCTPFLDRIKLSGYRMRIKCDREPLTVEQNNYATKL